MFCFILVGKVGVPKQLVVTGDPFSIPMEVQKACLSFPIGNILVPSLIFIKLDYILCSYFLLTYIISFVVAKPLVIDGTAKSHELSLAFDLSSLSLLDPPLVLQEFISHGIILSSKNCLKPLAEY